MSDPAAPGRVLLTGGSGRLGGALLPLLRGAGVEVVAPPRSDLDLLDPASVRAALARERPDLVVHAAAYTDVAGAERERDLCWRVNVGGTRALVAALQGAPATLVHVSTDYVFWGDRGGYREDDTPGPVRNTYALSKLAAEEVARLAPRHLVIRTSFRPDRWPYPVAFDDLYTSQDYLDVIAPEVALAVRRAHDVPHDTLHIATERKSAFELARRRRPDVERGSKTRGGVALPDDISLDASRWRALKEAWGAAPAEEAP